MATIISRSFFELDEKLFVIRCNLKRRHLNVSDRAFLANEEFKIYEEKARRKQEEAAKLGAEYGKLGGRPQTDWNSVLDNNPLDKKKSKKYNYPKREKETNKKIYTK